MHVSGPNRPKNKVLVGGGKLWDTLYNNTVDLYYVQGTHCQAFEQK